MGYGGYDHAAHSAHTSRRADLPRQVVFKETACIPEMNPHGLRVRESRDSAAHPDSLGIIFGLDVTGSMGHIPDLLARREMPHFMQIVMEAAGIRDPQILFMGIGDAFCDTAPLQVGQFESEDKLMDRWLTGTYLEGGGGGNEGESYDLALYVAARHTAMDCYEKRGRKGYLFVTGDEPHLGCVTAAHVNRLIGNELDADITIGEIAREAGKTFHAFFIIPDKDRARRCERPWRDVLGDHVIVLEDPHDACLAAGMIIGLTEGTIAGLDAAAAKLQQLGKPQEQVHRVIRAVEAYALAIGRGGEGREREEQGSEPRERGERSGNRRRGASPDAV